MKIIRKILCRLNKHRLYEIVGHLGTGWPIIGCACYHCDYAEDWRGGETTITSRKKMLDIQAGDL
jgi:hypothetical protein